MATIYIDNKPYEVPTGKNLLETCLTLGFDLPYFCWHTSLGSVGACRQCAVKLYKDKDDQRGRLVMSCMEPVSHHQYISIDDADAKTFRAHVIEWLMTSHPHDCAVCDEGGSCHLQDMTVMTGHHDRKYTFKKRTHTNQYLGPFINHEMNRCIQCYRCVRFYKDYAGGKDLDVFASRNNVYFGRHEEGTLESEFSGNLVEICPTGVFTDKTLKQHYTRKWDLTTAPSICHHCSLGCNTIAGERYGELRMISNRYNGEVNGYFLCDRGRFGYGFVNAKDRIRLPRINNQLVDSDRVFDALREALKNARVIGIGSPRASLQSNFALKALVGQDNFYHGVSSNEHDLADLILKILREGPSRTPTLKEVESADAVFILGEDLTNTAPMLALATRQSVRQQPLEKVSGAAIPSWNDAAAREHIQQDSGPLFIATISATKLDDVATDVYRGAPDDIARLGFAIAHCIDGEVPDVDRLDDRERKLAATIANTLSKAKRPVVISGASCESDHVIKAAANIAWALDRKTRQGEKEPAGLVLTLPECNSLGLAMMGGAQLSAAFDAVLHNHADTVIVMENDLYRHGKESVVKAFIQRCKQVIVFDYLNTPTVHQANIVIPAGTFAESDGILVSNEGRAQRFYQVFESTDVIQESWRWLLRIGEAANHPRVSAWKNYEELTQAMAREEALLPSVDKVSLPAEFRIAGQRIAREPHRYSGRTSMNAAVNVSEPKPPVDNDSSLSYTMEGYRGLPPSSMIPYFWSPGWNSVQAVNKYQIEVGHGLRGGDPGLRLIEPRQNARAPYFKSVPEAFKGMKDHLLVVPMHHIFGSDEASEFSPPVMERIPKAYVMINAEDAHTLAVNENEILAFDIEEQHYELPVKIASIPKGLAGIPYGFLGLPFVDLPAWCVVK